MYLSVEVTVPPLIEGFQCFECGDIEGNGAISLSDCTSVPTCSPGQVIIPLALRSTGSIEKR